MTPTVSVVVATRNYGRYVAGAVRSVLAQTVRDLELVIVDDGSTDDTPKVLETFAADPRVRVVRTNGLGQSPAKNLGIRLARGPLIAFLDGDDEWLPTKLERQLPLFDQSENGVVYCRRTLMDQTGKDMPTPSGEYVRGRVYDALLRQNFVCFSSVVVRKAVFESVGAFDPSLPLAIDYDLWLRVARHWEFDFVDEPLVRYRTGHGNLSSRITERVAGILSILRRSLVRRGNGATADSSAVGEAFGSTARTMAYVVRGQRPREAVGWYLTAARHDRKWGQSIRAAVAVMARWIGVRG